MKLSVIIPTYNEEKNIAQIIDFFQESNNCYEIIIVDGGSHDQTRSICAQKKVQLVDAPFKSRAKQMNLGAKKASGNIYYFVHADTRPLDSFYQDIKLSLEEGYKIGSYRFQFNSDSKKLKINAYFTRFNKLFCRGGDQTLFITKELFNQLEGYQEEMEIMEEYDLIRRAKKLVKFKVIPKDVIVSARKYDKNSYFKVSTANLVVFLMFYMGFSAKRMKRFYGSLVK